MPDPGSERPVEPVCRTRCAPPGRNETIIFSYYVVDRARMRTASMVRAPPRYWAGRRVTPRRTAAAAAASAGSRVQVIANSVGVMRRRLASDRLNATAVAAIATIAVSPATAARFPVGCAVHGGVHASTGTQPMISPHAVAEPGPTDRP